MGAHRLTPAQEMRVLVAFAAQPLVAALIAFAIFPIIEWTSRWLDGGRFGDPLQAAVSVALGAALVTILVVPLVALPAFAWLVRRGPLTRRRVLVSGALLGNVPGVAIVLLVAVHALTSGNHLELTRVTHDPLGLIRAGALGSFVGLVSASVFWLMIRRHMSQEPADGASAL